MSNLRRVGNIVLSSVAIAFGILLLLTPDFSLVIVAVVIGVWLMVHGMRKLVYFFTMARHMVGGLSLLFIAMIYIDLGASALTLVDEPRLSIVLYLVGCNALMGIFGILRGVEARRLGSRWKSSLVHGVVSLALAASSLLFIGSERVITAIFCLGLFYSACVRLVTALRPTEVIYIQ